MNMRIVSIQKFNSIMSEVTSGYRNCNVYIYWHRINKTLITPLSIFTFIMLSLSLEKELKMYGLLSNSIESSWLFVLSIISILLFITITIAFLHELIHILSFPKKFKKAIVIVDLPFTISVVYNDELKKSNYLKTLICPVLVLSILISILCILIKSIYIFAWLMTINITLASSDIFSFFYILKKVPSNAYLFGNYYRCQR